MRKKNFALFVYMLLSGLCVGWIIGLSVSPVVHIVVGSILALIVSLASAYAGLAKNDQDAGSQDQNNTDSFKKRLSRSVIDPRPIAILAIGLAVGSSFGVYARTNDWLSVDVEQVIKKWKGPGLDENKIRQRLFDEIYASSAEPKEKTNTQPSVSKSSTGLYSAFTSDQCGTIQLKEGKQLYYALHDLKDKRVDAFLNICRDSLALEALKEYICKEAE